MIGSFIIYPNNSADVTQVNYTKINLSCITLYLDVESHIHEKWSKRELILLGDPIYDFDLENLEVNDIIRTVKGNYYGILIKGKEVLVFSSFLSILPIYYIAGSYECSNRIELLKDSISKTDIDKQFILETTLFNYSFSKRTIYSQIKLLDTNHILTYNSSKVTISKGISVAELFLQGASMEDLSLDSISRVFIQTIENYLPTSDFSITFTGGFDSRTLVGSAIHYNRKFRTCSFGNKTSSDISLPLKHSGELGFNHIPYYLDEPDYTNGIYKEKALAFTEICPGFNGFLYPHFSLIAEEESKTSDYLITGYFGSELFRSLHIAGAVTSRTLVELFSNREEKNINTIINDPRYLQGINIDQFKNELSSLEIEISNYFQSNQNNLSRNEEFYKFILEETFRKLFGTLINMQQQYIKVRTPYLDYSFIKKLFRSKYAGVNCEFFVHNPAKRISGQQVYAAILKRTSDKLFIQRTGKGYKPSSLLGPLAPVKLLLPAITKKISKKLSVKDLDNLGILSGFNNSVHLLEESIADYADLFDQKSIMKVISSGEMERDEYIRDRVLSIISLLMSF